MCAETNIVAFKVVVYDAGVPPITLREVGICRQLSIPLLSGSRILVVVADLSVHVVTHIGMIGEELANS